MPFGNGLVRCVNSTASNEVAKVLKIVLQGQGFTEVPKAASQDGERRRSRNQSCVGRGGRASPPFSCEELEVEGGACFFCRLLRHAPRRQCLKSHPKQKGRCADLGGHMHQVLGQDWVPEEQSVQLNFVHKEEEQQDDSAR